MSPEAAAGETRLSLDRRFGFAWRVAPSGRKDRPILIAVHDSDRDCFRTRDVFTPLALQQDLSVLAPHFPCRAITPSIADGYKFLCEPGANYVDLLEAMLHTFAAARPFDRSRVFLFGFSGGGQFAHRYGLVAASRLAGVVIASPGSVTLLDETLPWWPGVAGIERVVGRPVDRRGLDGLPMHFIVGSNDLIEGMARRAPGDPYYSPFGQAAGANRIEMLEHLAESFRNNGAAASLERLAGVGHDLEPIAAAAIAHFSTLLT